MNVIPAKINAAVLYKHDKPLKVISLITPKLQKGQVFVKIFYSGVCKSQLMEIKGKRGKDIWLPHLLGHEAVGKVISVGPGVKKVKKNDEVILSWIKGEGLDVSGAIFKNRKQYINSGPVTTFSNYSIVSENRVYKKPKYLSYKTAVLFGCALPTGCGIIYNELNIKKNDKRNFLIYGLGGIGISALLALKSKNIKNIFVVDKCTKKLNFAKTIGVKNIYSTKENNYRKKIFKKSKSGVDVCIECAGYVSTIEDAFSLINPKKGQLIFSSHPDNKEPIKLYPHELISGKQIKGSWGGKTNLDRDISKISKNLKNMKQTLNKLINKEYSLEDINFAINDLDKNKVFRAIIKMHH